MPLIYLSACHKRNNGSLTDNVAKKKGKRDGSGEKYYRNRRLETISPEFPIVTRQGKYGTRKRTINESFRGPTDQSIDHLTRILPSFLSPRLFAAQDQKVALSNCTLCFPARLRQSVFRLSTHSQQMFLSRNRKMQVTRALFAHSRICSLVFSKERRRVTRVQRADN